ncbi:MAG: hypothetical protein COV74_05045 [Candidatus Omnitrophica bacterium CG11_big_fil_rev_8_21_14_0_20_45_26]|uniref:Endo-beta-1,2-glucanase SGL domain-containing protein n=1 Tax=Candidatus Abzuiibacterium crystallinum TaxID=1974748 RepID=A0A2H0LPK0_9BACT|nr:MAG: hypothetical protein COV74_05045 [Candidatus Omnitrophica bacterium CG11_big_fil_rev_8_21_14_0_20_45_26]PIW64361.1 MAG: hypothetical protein COW12_06495 [Candidatus Omnitrophica bacterium CG12_big_fil_rev_8_21_14_0_65_45_16]
MLMRSKQFFFKAISLVAVLSFTFTSTAAYSDITFRDLDLDQDLISHMRPMSIENTGPAWLEGLLPRTTTVTNRKPQVTRSSLSDEGAKKDLATQKLLNRSELRTQRGVSWRDLLLLGMTGAIGFFPLACKKKAEENHQAATSKESAESVVTETPAEIPTASAETPAAPSSYRFAPKYSLKSLVSDTSLRDAFLKEFLYWDGKFHQAGVAYNEKSGITYDGYMFDIETGQLVGGPHNWSAASKESLHVAILAMAISGNEQAKMFVSPDNPGKAEEIALDLLTKKIASYEKFNREYPGFGGFLPWFLVFDEGLKPTENPKKAEYDWSHRVPSLDNGEWVWSLYLAYHTLASAGYQALSVQYKDYFDLLAKNVVTVFYEGDGKVRAETTLVDNQATPRPRNYGNEKSSYYLDDPYEGELMVFFMTLFGQWSNSNDIDRMWELKRKKLVSASYKTPEGHLTIQRGHWFSAHEQWKYLVLPYTSIPIARDIFLNGEKARTWYSHTHNIPGLFASTYNVVTDHSAPLYLSALGIPELAAQAKVQQNVVAPYASFPVILAARESGAVGIGEAWLALMLQGPRMQNSYGSTESISVQGTAISPIITWDTKGLVALALMGGISEPIQKALQEDGKFDAFSQIVEREHRLAFPRVEGEEIGFAEPASTIPHRLREFDASAGTSKVDVLLGTNFDGEGWLQMEHRFVRGKSLSLPKGPGYVWNRITNVNLQENPILDFEVKSDRERGWFFLEVKNTDDQSITALPIVIYLKGTNGAVKHFSIDLREQGFARENLKGAFVSFADPTSSLEFRFMRFMPSRPRGRVGVLSFDGRRFIEGGKNQFDSSNLLTQINFRIGDLSEFSHDRNLQVEGWHGWVWASTPPIDIGKKHYLILKVRTNAQISSFMEFKNQKSKPIIGGANLGGIKMPLNIPNTHGSTKTLVIDLSNHFMEVADKTATIIAFSNFSSLLEIESIQFSEIKPKSELRSVAYTTSSFSDQDSPVKLATFSEELRREWERLADEGKTTRWPDFQNPIKIGKFEAVINPHGFAEAPKWKGLKPVREIRVEDFNFYKIKGLVKIFERLHFFGSDYFVMPDKNPTMRHHSLMVSSEVRPNTLTQGDIQTALLITAHHPDLKFLQNTEAYTANHFHMHITTQEFPFERLGQVREKVLGIKNGVTVSTLSEWPLTNVNFRGDDLNRVTEEASQLIDVLKAEKVIPHWTFVRNGQVTVFIGNQTPQPIAEVGDVLGQYHTFHALGTVGVLMLEAEKNEGGQTRENEKIKEILGKLTERNIEQAFQLKSLSDEAFATLLQKIGLPSTPRSELRTQGFIDSLNPAFASAASVADEVVLASSVTGAVESLVNPGARSELRKFFAVDQSVPAEGTRFSVFGHSLFNQALPAMAAYAIDQNQPMAVVYATRSELREIERLNAQVGVLALPNGLQVDPLIPAASPREAVQKLRRLTARAGILARYIYYTLLEKDADRVKDAFQEVRVFSRQEFDTFIHSVAGLAKHLHSFQKTLNRIAEAA